MQTPETTRAPAALRVDGISKRFGGLSVFENLSFELGHRETLGVIGPNGAGKTTLINVLCGWTPRSAGTIQLEGREIGGLPLHGVSRLGLLRSFQQTSIFGSRSVRENMDYARDFSRADYAEDSIAGMLERYGLLARLDERADSLPYGLQKLLGLMLAYACRPKVLLLDEPAAGLETRERRHIDDFIQLARDNLGCSLIVVEHDIDLIRRLCDRAIVLDGGRLIADGTPDAVLQRQDVLRAYLGDFEEATDAQHP